MKNTIGNSVSVTLFGESHGKEIGAVLDGIAPGIAVDEEFIAHQLTLRRPAGEWSTARVEPDPFRIVSGVYRGRTTGTPICILIPNTDAAESGDAPNAPRPGHADYTAQCKYHGYQDARGGGHFSGRLTAPLVAAGAIALSVLRQSGILVGTHIARIAGVCDRSFSASPESEIEQLDDLSFAVLDPAAGDAMKKEILDAKADGDSVGGILETAVTGLPAGVGEPWFDTVEGVLSHALFSIPAVKGVEFGAGFGFSSMRGSEANDEFRVNRGKIVTATNHNGGINGGITNGMPLIFRLAVKPTPSIALPQETVDLATMRPETLRVTGRHDPSILPRARVVVDSVTALVLCDLMAQRYGTDFADAGE